LRRRISKRAIVIEQTIDPAVSGYGSAFKKIKVHTYRKRWHFSGNLKCLGCAGHIDHNRSAGQNAVGMGLGNRLIHSFTKPEIICIYYDSLIHPQTSLNATINQVNQILPLSSILGSKEKTRLLIFGYLLLAVLSCKQRIEPFRQKEQKDCRVGRENRAGQAFGRSGAFRASAPTLLTIRGYANMVL